MLNDPEMLKGWQPFLGAKVLEIGANVGVYTQYCAERDAQVTAYEADPITFTVLAKKNLPAQIINKAVWTYTGFCSFRGFTREECNAHNGALAHINCPDNGLFRPAQQIPCVSFDEAIGEEEWDCVKVDIEGSEFEMLLSASDSSLRKIKFMYVEFHPWWVDQGLPEKLLQRLREFFNLEGILTDYVCATRRI